MYTSASEHNLPLFVEKWTPSQLLTCEWRWRLTSGMVLNDVMMNNCRHYTYISQILPPNPKIFFFIFKIYEGHTNCPIAWPTVYSIILPFAKPILLPLMSKKQYGLKLGWVGSVYPPDFRFRVLEIVPGRVRPGLDFLQLGSGSGLIWRKSTISKNEIHKGSNELQNNKSRDCEFWWLTNENEVMR
jgi:hypothetical protein